METIEDILREMREFADTESQSIGRDVLRRRIQHFADRLEAAVEYTIAVEKAKAAGEGYAVGKQSATCKESLQVGNAAKMREALKAVYECAKDGVLTIRESAFEKVLSALAEPPRNCDVGTEKEQSDLFVVQCNDYRATHGNCFGCPCLRTTGRCEFNWAQMPYESEVK